LYLFCCLLFWWFLFLFKPNFDFCSWLLFCFVLMIGFFLVNPIVIWYYTNTTFV
jgi:hypothetical protein